MEGPSIINSIFLEEGKGPHFSQSKPFPKAPDKKKRKKKKKVIQQLSRTPGSQETQSPHGLRTLWQQVYEDAQEAKFPFTF